MTEMREQDRAVRSLWRYPVKSMQGEACQELNMETKRPSRGTAVGCVGPHVQTPSFRPNVDGRLLEAAATLHDGDVSVRLPGAQDLDPGDVLDENLTRMAGTAGQMVEAVSHGVATSKRRKIMSAMIQTWSSGRERCSFSTRSPSTCDDGRPRAPQFGASPICTGRSSIPSQRGALTQVTAAWPRRGGCDASELVRGD